MYVMSHCQLLDFIWLDIKIFKHYYHKMFYIFIGSHGSGKYSDLCG